VLGGVYSRSHSFTPDRESAVSVDWQKIKIQELETEHNVRTLPSHLCHDWEGLCQAKCVVPCCDNQPRTLVGSLALLSVS
jgi:hypothetical protein